MRSITHYILVIVLFLGVQLSAQEENNTERIAGLKEQREKITTQERAYLKTEVEAINIRLAEGEISKEKADKLKREVAEKRAKNIENRTAIIDNKIALLERNNEGYKPNDDKSSIYFELDEENYFPKLKISNSGKPVKYDRRTTSALVVAIGFNNAIIDGEKFDDTPYKIGGSHFFELGWAWKTRVFKESNFLRIKYGVSFQFNGLKADDNMYFVQNGDVTSLELHPFDVKKAKLNVTNMVFPVHFEFGPSSKKEYATHFRYSTNRQFKVGLGGYVGFKTGVYQKLKFKENGEKQKEKNKNSFNTSNSIYGLSGYLAWGHTALYVKYDLNTVFKNQAVDQHNISLGLRFDMD
ncbi:MAG: hypothetical protein COB73_02390 [Flavobacteriaceae bacterium]|nr:MAG: hypothetical protein COB73_02390 [Flavobacteriaceae bacterium]